MRIKKISSDKVVVQLTDTDLENFDLDFEERIPQAADLHKLLFEVMEIVKNETGFDAYRGGQVVVEATPSDNGISLVITKIRTDKKAITRKEFSQIKQIKVKPSSKSGLSHDEIADIAQRLGILKKAKKKKTENISFIFNNFSDFEDAVCAASDLDFNGLALYRNGERYAITSKHNPDIKDFNILSEYAIHTARNNVASYDIKEGWAFVAKSDELSRMADELRRMQ